MKLDLLVLAVHPDDAELCCAGTIIKHVQEGKKVGVVDFTQGELGTRGTPEIRLKEAEEAGKVMGLSVRENLNFKDGFFANDNDHKMEVIRVIRKFQPEIVIANALFDRHPDHERAGQLSREACFLAGLMKIETEVDGKEQKPWRPGIVMHFPQHWYIKPSIVVDITDHFDRKMEAIKAYKSQFHDPESDEPETILTSPEFLKAIEARDRELGSQLRVKYGEGYYIERDFGVNNLFNLI